MLVTILFFSACKTEKSNTKEDEPSVEESLYFGQNPPGLTPELFAPGVVSVNGRFESTISFSPNLKELYFDAKYEDEPSQIYYSKQVNGTWTSIKKASFTKGNKKEELHPFVSPNGKRVYFTAFDSIFLDERVWYVNRLSDTWGEAIKLDSPVNDDKVFFPNHAKNDGLYYFNLSKFKTYYAANKNGEFIEPTKVDIEMGHHAFISPKNDYLLVTARSNQEENRKDNDIYVYFKHQDGTWANPINLGAHINTNFSEKTPTISPDGKYLFFGRDERDIEPGLANIYWVSTAIIEKLRPKKDGTQETVKIFNQFNPEEVNWFKTKGDATIKGIANFKSKEGTMLLGEQFAIELMPYSNYANERLGNIYKNKNSGYVYIADGVPQFTPDPEGYHDTIKTKCNKDGTFEFLNLPEGEYYLVAFMIKGDIGGGIMRRVKLSKGESKFIEMTNI